MSRFHSYLNSAKAILQQYKGEVPLASFIKKYYSNHKKHGSKDRKQISHFCYCFFRLGKVVLNTSMDEKMLIALFLCSNESNEILAALKPEWNEKVSLGVEEKYSICNHDSNRDQFSIFNVFPWKDELSDGIDYKKFCASFFYQPDLFLRIRPGHAEQVLRKLDDAAVAFEFISPFTIRLPNSFNAEKYFDIDSEVVIQDYSSQQITHFLPVNHGKSLRVWDGCAGSGGKSIMAYDLNPEIDITVTDNRKSIISNLKKRFSKAGIKNYKSKVVDLTRSHEKVSGDYDLIIADVPCTGSGTWSRTPEQLFFFDPRKIEYYSDLQKKIISNVIPALRPGGSLVYITCSVFRKENEEGVDFIRQSTSLKLKNMEMIKGYEQKADNLFVALFTY